MDGEKRAMGVLARYALILVAAASDFFVFYFVFGPLTVYPVHLIIGVFSESFLIGDVLLVEGVPVKFVRACIAGSAYYFLFLLNLSTPGVEIGRRLRVLFLSFLSFLSFNVARILALIWLHFNGSSFFDDVHWFLWHFMSTLLVVGIWFFQIRRLGDGKVPVFSDVKFLIGRIRGGREEKSFTAGRSRRKKLQSCIFP